MLTLIPGIIRAPVYRPAPRFYVTNVGAIYSGRQPGTIETLMIAMRQNARRLPSPEEVLTIIWPAEVLIAGRPERTEALRHFVGREICFQ